MKQRCPFLCRPTLCQLLLTLFLPSLRQCLRNHRLQLSTKEDSSQPASQSIPPKPASVPEDTPASPLKSTEADSSQPAYNSIPPKPASLPEKSLPSPLKSTEEDSSEPTSHSIQKPALVPEKASPSSLKSTEADSSQSSTKVGSSFASSSHSSSFTSSFKPASTSDALTSSSPTKANLSSTLNVLQSDLIGDQGMKMYDVCSSESNLYDSIEEEKVHLLKKQFLSYPWSERKKIEDG